MSPGLIQFLQKVGERNSFAVKDAGRPTPEHIYDEFKILSMLEVLLGECRDQETLKRVEHIATWSPK